jgi:indole-3-glycerol phosphate synthase
VNATVKGTVLERIASRTIERVARRRREVPLVKHLAATRGMAPVRSLRRALQADEPRFVAEVKRASPSAGPIAPSADPVVVAGQYLEQGAAAISILTEPDFFQGDPAFLSAVRRQFPQSCLLMKDFFVDEYQVAEARAIGADAILLIAALLDDAELAALYALARELGLSPLVEVHDESELDRAVALGARLVGVNNRDLRTLAVSLDVSRRLARRLPQGVTAVAESGLRSGIEVRELFTLGYRGFLVGSSLMETGDPGAALGRLRREAGCA